jgi:hypothetical protein
MGCIGLEYLIIDLELSAFNYWIIHICRISLTPYLGMKTDRIRTDTADTDTDNFSFSV